MDFVLINWNAMKTKHLKSISVTSLICIIKESVWIWILKSFVKSFITFMYFPVSWLNYMSEWFLIIFYQMIWKLSILRSVSKQMKMKKKTECVQRNSYNVKALSWSQASPCKWLLLIKSTPARAILANERFLKDLL